MIAEDFRGEFVRRALAAEPVLVHLYSNDYTPSSLRPPSLDQLVEVTGSDYAAKRISPTSWSVEAEAAVAQPVRWDFEHRHGAVVGYFVTGVESRLLLWAERFVDGPYRMEAAQDSITIDPRVTWAG